MSTSSFLISKYWCPPGPVWRGWDGEEEQSLTCGMAAWKESVFRRMLASRGSCMKFSMKLLRKQEAIEVKVEDMDFGQPGFKYFLRSSRAC